MDANLPVSQLLAMALATKPEGLGKGDPFAGYQPQSIPVLGMVTVETPELPSGMLQGNGGMLILEFPTLPVGFHLGVAIGAGENPLG